MVALSFAWIKMTIETGVFGRAYVPSIPSCYRQWTVIAVIPHTSVSIVELWPARQVNNESNPMGQRSQLNSKGEREAIQWQRIGMARGKFKLTQ